MSVAERIESLKSRHAELEARLEEELSHPGSSDDIIHALKKEKLAVKDELQALVD